MIKRLKVSLYAAALAGIGLLATGCSLGGGLGWGTKIDSVPRILAAILREDLFS